MNSEHLEALKEYFDFETWAGIGQSRPEVSLRNVSLPESLVSGLDPRRMREIDPGDGNRLLRASWSVPERGQAVLVVDLWECRSREVAHEVVLELLANMQAPDVKRLEDSPVGDIAFGRETKTALVFARANIVVNVRNGGETVVQVDEVASALDSWIMQEIKEQITVHPG